MCSKIKLQKETEKKLIFLRCQYIDLIQKLIDVHLKIDPPDHELTNEDNDMFFRMRKCLFHALMIKDLGCYNDTLHIIAVECRAMKEQLAKAVVTNKRDDMLSLFVHTSSQRLIQNQSIGGLASENRIVLFGTMLSMLLNLGFLYCAALQLLNKSSGFKVANNELTEIQNKFQDLLNQLPKIPDIKHLLLQNKDKI